MGYPPFSLPGSAVEPPTRRDDPMPSIQDFLDELPSIDDYIDYSSTELPPIDDFLARDTAAESWRPQDEAAPSSEFDSDGWAIAGWQSFDWSGAAALGVTSQERSTAADSWGVQQWSEAPLSKGAAARRSAYLAPSADEVARALDGIAKRIRSGELLIDQLSGTPPEAAMAAAIAALLRMRD